MEGKLACTPLFKKDLPLINYVVGDKVVGEIRDGELFITGVQGRLNDTFKYETGENSYADSRPFFSLFKKEKMKNLL